MFLIGQLSTGSGPSMGPRSLFLNSEGLNVPMRVVLKNGNSLLTGVERRATFSESAMLARAFRILQSSNSFNLAYKHKAISNNKGSYAMDLPN